MTNMPASDPVLVNPRAGDSFSNSNGKSGDRFVKDLTDELSATAVALRKRTSKDIITPETFTTVPGSMINDTTSLTGWGHNGFTGTPVIASGVFVRVPAMLYGATFGSAWLDLASPLSTGSHDWVGVGLSFTAVTGSYPSGPYFELVVADGTGLTGNIRTTSVGGALTLFRTFQVPLDGLTTIRSIGLRANRSGGTGTQRADWYFYQVRFLDEGPVSQALSSQGTVAEFIPPGSPDEVVPVAVPYGAAEAPKLLPSTKTVFDLRPWNAHISRLGGKRHIREFGGTDPTGVQDSSQGFNTAINEMRNGGTLQLEDEASYLCVSALYFNGVQDFLLEGNGASLSSLPLEGPQGGMFSMTGGQRIEVRDLHIFGARFWTLDSSQTTVITPTVNFGPLATQYSLMTQGATIASPASVYYARDANGDNVFGFTVHQDSPVLNDCQIWFQDSLGNILASQTLTLTATPTTYTLRGKPLDLGATIRGYVKKLTTSPNPIVYSNMIQHMKIEYQGGDEETAAGFGISHSSYITVRNCSVEGMGGDGFQHSAGSSSQSVDAIGHHYLFQNFFSRGNRRQGCSFNTGEHLVMEDFTIREPGRSGLDIEPYGPGWSVKDVWLRRGAFIHSRNAAITGKANGLFPVPRPGGGFHFEDLVMDDLFTISDSTDSTYRNIVAGTGFRAAGKNIQVENVTAAYAYIGGTGRVNGLRITSERGGTYGPRFSFEPGILVSGFQMLGVDTVFTGVNTNSGTAVPDGPYLGMDVSRWVDWFPNQIKARTAYSDVWVPNGLDHHDAPVYRVKGLSGSAVKNVNLRGLDVPITLGATTTTVTFPTRSATVRAPTVSYAVGTLTGMTAGTYYYRSGPRSSYTGPAAWSPEVAVTLPGNTCVNITLKNILTADLTTSQDLFEGFSFVRGPTGGPYTYRCDVTLADPPWANAISTGSTATGPVFDQNLVGTALWAAGDVNNPVPNAFRAVGQAGSFTCVDESGWEPDTNYAIQVTPSWDTSVAVTAKRRNGFDLAFSAAPSGATLDWLLIR